MCQILESTSVRQWRDRSLWSLHRTAVGGADPHDPELGFHGNRCAVQLAYSTVQWAPNARYSDCDPAADDGPLPWEVGDRAQRDAGGLPIAFDREPVSCHAYRRGYRRIVQDADYQRSHRGCIV